MAALVGLVQSRRATREAGGLQTPAPGEVTFGDFHRLTPVSSNWGFDRGQPIDRYYIEGFLRRHAADVRGRVLEVGDDGYTRTFGGSRVTDSDVLHVRHWNRGVTVVADLTQAPDLPSASYDCIVLTQTLQLIFDVPSALRTLQRILVPGGVLLVTMPGITKLVVDEDGDHQYWTFTSRSAGRLFDAVFGPGQALVEGHGNVLAATAFLHGLAVEEMQKTELDERDPHYEVIVAVRAVKT